MAMPARMAMIVRTIINSSKVKPRLPVTVFGPVKSRSIGFRVYIENVLSTPGFVFGVVLVGAHSPLCRIRHRIDGNTPQEFQFLIDGTHLGNAIDQVLQLCRVSVTIEGLLNLTGVRCGLKFVED